MAECVSVEELLANKKRPMTFNEIVLQMGLSRASASSQLRRLVLVGRVVKLRLRIGGALLFLYGLSSSHSSFPEVGSFELQKVERKRNRRGKPGTSWLANVWQSLNISKLVLLVSGGEINATQGKAYAHGSEEAWSSRQHGHWTGDRCDPDCISGVACVSGRCGQQHCVGHDSNDHRPHSLVHGNSSSGVCGSKSGLDVVRFGGTI